jgi:ribosomal protein S27E
MASPVVSERFRAVVCRHCGKPIRVPALVTRRESEFHGLSDSGSTEYQLISRVFNVRCRSCERESVYSINQIVDCAYPLTQVAADKTAAV